ncbi:unnamed protein product [Didymodactylos carnosus]|uniref:Uncharacterized protein n=1 Tax=Didymodactylos carnosus TaxID=1234261 RepID=A0A8S2FRH9_9BILA|nr:unnamed protein product [Didymodactylos carnosus]CAF4329757.1 unnamed protein product [Didymodactylos carnosus]
MSLRTYYVPISGINTTPFSVMFGCAPKLGLSSLPLPSATINRLTKEEQLLTLIGQYGINPSGDTDSSGGIELSDDNNASNTDKTVPGVDNNADDDMEVENNNNDEHDSICHRPKQVGLSPVGSGSGRRKRF